MAEEEAKHIVLELGGRDFRFVRQAALRNYDTFINSAVIPGAAAAIRNVSNSTQDRSSCIGRLVVNTDTFYADKFRTLLEMEALG